LTAPLAGRAVGVRRVRASGLRGLLTDSS